MSEIIENAFQIARYLVENPEKDEQTEIRNELSLSEQDFSLALKTLVDDGLCQTAGSFGTGIIRQKKWTQLQNFIDQIGKNRLIFSRNAENLLKFLFSDQSDDFPFSIYTQAMTKFGWNEKQYIQAAQELADRNMVTGEYAGGNSFNKFFLTPNGRETVLRNFRLPPREIGEIHVDIRGGNNIVNVNSILTSVQQTIQANTFIDPSQREKLEQLLSNLEYELKNIPPENADEAEAVAETAKDLIEKATKEKPNKPLVQISADGLKKAAENIAVITPKVLVTAQAIIAFVMQLQK